jgi:hypothetical protein
MRKFSKRSRRNASSFVSRKSIALTVLIGGASFVAWSLVSSDGGEAKRAAGARSMEIALR